MNILEKFNNLTISYLFLIIISSLNFISSKLINRKIDEGKLNIEKKK